MITWSGFLFSHLKYLQLTKFSSKFRILNRLTTKGEVLLFKGEQQYLEENHRDLNFHKDWIRDFETK